jgi:hypothetical protein
VYSLLSQPFYYKDSEAIIRFFVHNCTCGSRRTPLRRVLLPPQGFIELASGELNQIESSSTREARHDATVRGQVRTKCLNSRGCTLLTLSSLCHTTFTLIEIVPVRGSSVLRSHLIRYASSKIQHFLHSCNLRTTKHTDSIDFEHRTFLNFDSSIESIQNSIE